jgi:predicted Zn finger-like uncharacterized protein
MIITCPACATRFNVDPASLSPSGRTVRCANCGHRWHAAPPEDAPRIVDTPPADLPIPPGPAAVPRARPTPRPERRRRLGSASLIGWLIGVLLVLILAAAIIGRNEVVAIFPEAAPVYQKVGLSVTLPLGLQFENVTSERFDERGIAILVIEGDIVNLSEQPRDVPQVRITLLDDSGREIHQELFEPADSKLESGGKTQFSGRLVNPAAEARNFSVTFDVPS